MSRFVFLMIAASCVPWASCEESLSAPPPGRWDHSQHNWIADAKDDQLLDLIGPQFPDVAFVDQDAIHGMSFGDSNDRNIINDYCAKDEPHPPQHEIHSIRGCWHSHLTITWQPLVGIHPTGPFSLSQHWLAYSTSKRPICTGS